MHECSLYLGISCKIFQTANGTMLLISFLHWLEITSHPGVFWGRVTAVNGKYMIGVYTLRKIEFGEELTFDYCCVTEVCVLHEMWFVSGVSFVVFISLMLHL